MRWFRGSCRKLQQPCCDGPFRPKNIAYIVEEYKHPETIHFDTCQVRDYAVIRKKKDGVLLYV